MLKRYLKRKSIPLIIAGLFTSPTFAEEDFIELKEVAVWDTTISASSVHFGEDAFAIKQADHISDLLRSVPGVDVGGAHSLNQRITIRSMDDKDLRISIDGANQNTYMYHHMGNLQINADILQAVDIDVGTNSVVNGGLGGAVRFKTKTAKQLLRDGEQFGGRIQASYGSNKYQSYSLTGYGQMSDSVDFLAYFNNVDRGNFRVGGGQIKDADNIEIPNTNGKVKGLEGDLDNMLLKMGWDIDTQQRISFGYERYRDQGDYAYRPDMGVATDLAIANSLGLPLTYDTEFDRDTYTLNYVLDWGTANTLDATIYSNTSEFNRDESAIATAFPGDPADVRGTAKNTGLNLLAMSEIGTDIIHTLSYGTEIIKNDTEYKGDNARSKEDALSTAVFLEDRIDINQQFAVIPGVRYNTVDLDSTVVDDRFTRLTGAMAMEYRVNPNFLVKLSTTQLFKAPEIGEVVIGAGLYDTPNAGIKEETGYNSELAFAYQDRVLGADRFTSGVTFFQTDIDDYIYDYAPPPPSVGGRSWKDNIGDMSIQGYEAYIGYDKGNLRTLLTFATAESELDAIDQYSTFEGARLDRTQGDTVSFNLDYTLPRWDLALHWDFQYVGGVRADLDLDGATADNAKDSFNVHNLSARWSPRQVKGLDLTIGVDNLFDEYYASHSSRTGRSTHPRFGNLFLLDYEPGRNVKMTASYQF